ncbi:helix-turn-helix transcriptional regulator [Phormidium sp. CLA17]|uniref:LuxR C-terminal-related transcriptional regulator n=1 Tax=Leptolyngbya sp. Cla-17 TaxID=2803751 RepID=UPI0014928862|nr:LuxR C-terminal-related transcriptional regulator [Leptolyngbya sp. Cla-17]MBM0742408.1 helix-turn-helix transcriptional regulator [Leptolyngbya sp. Cla-17]
MNSPISSVKTAKTARSLKTNCILLQEIVENLIDGVLIVTTTGEWVYGNYNAHRICQQLNVGQPTAEMVPQKVWQICQVFIANHQVLSEPTTIEPVMVEAEITIELAVRYRVRVRWFRLEDTHSPHLLVTLEDCDQVARSRAIAEINQYGLTARQADVWLLHRTGHTYRDIATKLFVAINTVKRHMKDIYLKQKLHSV